MTFPGTPERVHDQFRRCECGAVVKLLCVGRWRWVAYYGLNHQDVSFEIVEQAGRYVAKLFVVDNKNVWGGPPAGYAWWEADLGGTPPDPKAIKLTVSLSEDGGLGCTPAETVSVASLPEGDLCANEPEEYFCPTVCDCESRKTGGPSMVAVNISGFGKLIPGFEGNDDHPICYEINRQLIMPVTGSVAISSCEFGYKESDGGTNWWREFVVSGEISYNPRTGQTSIIVLVRRGSGALGWWSYEFDGVYSKVLDRRINCRGEGPMTLDLRPDTVLSFCAPGSVTLQVLG